MWHDLVLNVLFFFSSISYQVIAISNAIVINTKANKIYFLFYRLHFFIKNCWISFCFFYNFITLNHWFINNNWKIFTIFATTYSRIPNIIFFAQILFFPIFTLTSTYIAIPLLLWITFLTIIPLFSFVWYMFCKNL